MQGEIIFIYKRKDKSTKQNPRGGKHYRIQNKNFKKEHTKRVTGEQEHMTRLRSDTDCKHKGTYKRDKSGR